MICLLHLLELRVSTDHALSPTLPTQRNLAIKRHVSLEQTSESRLRRRKTNLNIRRNG